MKIIGMIVMMVVISSFSYGQTSERNFSNILQNYYVYKDKDLVDKTIDFVNHSTITYQKIEPILSGFFGALFLSDKEVKKSFESHFDKIEKQEIRKLMMILSAANRDTLYS